MHEVKLFTRFAQILHRPNSIDYINILKTTRQSAVAMIFRIKDHNHPIHLSSTSCKRSDSSNPEICTHDKLNTLWVELDSPSLELLLVKRATNPRDLHSGQIAFPGGKCDNSETDYEAVLRETMEEVGLDLQNTQKFAYLGRYPTNFFAYYHKGLATYISVHVFIALDKLELCASPDEIEQCFWVPLKFFTEPERLRISVYENTKSQMSTLVRKDNSMKGKIASYILKDYKSINIPQIRLMNNEILYGLTLYMIIYMMERMSEFEHDEERKQRLKILCKAMHEFEIRFHGEKQPMLRKYLAESWYYHRRLEQFEKWPTLAWKLWLLNKEF